MFAEAGQKAGEVRIQPVDEEWEKQLPCSPYYPKTVYLGSYSNVISFW